MRLYYLDKYMKFETEKLNFKQLPIEKIVLNSKEELWFAGHDFNLDKWITAQCYF